LGANTRIPQYLAAQGSVQNFAQRDVSGDWRGERAPDDALQCRFYNLVIERARLDDLSQLAENVMEHSVEMVCPIGADRRESWIDHAQDAEGVTDRANQHGLSLPGKQLVCGDEPVERVSRFAGRDNHSLMAG
jgi:hypothetical protein